MSWPWILLACVMALALPAAAASDLAEPTDDAGVLQVSARRANFKQENASQNAQKIAQWAIGSGDTQGLPFVIVDKVDAKVFVFDRDGQLLGASPALVGLARGDDTVPGIGTRKLSKIRPHERTTPAGRFVASLERSLHGDDILWVDYDAAIALHRVVELPNERRLQRLASSNPRDRRITYGCINVPLAFFDSIVGAAFKGTTGIVYVLPEVRGLHQVFGYHDAEQNTAAVSTRSQAVPHKGALSAGAPAMEPRARALESAARLRY
jgi:hypothetical protein